MTTWRRSLVVAVAVAMSAALSGGCGLPGEGTVTTVDDDAVPYRLLAPNSPSSEPTGDPAVPGPGPVVYWVRGDRVLPDASVGSCSSPPEEVVGSLLGTLAAGPSDEARSSGLSSALPPDVGLELVALEGGTASVAVDGATGISAERLPTAVGQVVLSVTSAPTVRSVVLMSGGEPLQVPLPGGALAAGPVTAGDYQVLLPPRTAHDPGPVCP